MTQKEKVKRVDNLVKEVNKIFINAGFGKPVTGNQTGCGIYIPPRKKATEKSDKK